ncbi:MAG: type II toxin-antitoxin system RelB/DinJ family antitoxin [Methanomassiliicoccaceae archaeon]|jgi:asparagine synthase (glutamine-hydrolysing)|nr:type II toxin-antitoxin system RelB/DinJ family antitoxin [Methanomassiliicoccaceae archaeon]
MPFKYAGMEETIINAVKEAVEGKDVAVAFSGGLDSGLMSAIAKKYAASVHLYTCGTNRSHDVTMAKDLSERLELPWTQAEISKRNVEGLIKEMISSTGTTDPFTISYELQLFCVCREAKEDIVITGQGADEYFMGCAKFVDQTDKDYEMQRKAAVERLLKVSIPCELAIAKHFGKELLYPYMSEEILSAVKELTEEELRPKDMDSRKSILRDIAEHLGYPYIASRVKKSSQYGSGTTDIIRQLAREKGMHYNEYIASLCDEMLSGHTKNRGSVINARVDSIVKVEAEKILQQLKLSPSEAVELFYKKIIEDGNIQFIEKPLKKD